MYQRWLNFKRIFVFILLLDGNLFTLIHAASLTDTCKVNEVCSSALLIPNVFSDEDFICITGCNLNAPTDHSNLYCNHDIAPSTWFKIETDGSAGMMNIQVKSDDFKRPLISLYLAIDGCNQFVAIPLEYSWCAIGFDGKTSVIGTEIESHQTYYIVVGALNEIGGLFEMCINTVSYTSHCRMEGSIEMTGRSSGRPLADPLLPGESVNICLNVDSYTSINNGCQWFQGLIPRFGNGWDTTYFFDSRQPINTMLNGTYLGNGNGLYGAATWLWFPYIGYHYANPYLQIDDMDGDGNLDICNSLYEADCPDLGGTFEGCCSPCWNFSGPWLPGGWFAYGNNGTCSSSGHPTVDWGDGNTCSGTMGPWSFCFTLKVSPSLNCSQAPETRSLEIGYMTTSDGETGAWPGGPLVCRNDKPILRRFELECVTVFALPADTIGPQCSEEPFVFTIEHPGVEYWHWSVDKDGDDLEYTGNGPNGTQFEEMFYNYKNQARPVTYTFWSLPDSLNQIYSKKIVLWVYPTIVHYYTPPIYICEYSLYPLILDPRFKGGFGKLKYSWEPGGDTTKALVLHYPFEERIYTGSAIDENGCTGAAEIKVRLKDNCVLVIEDEHDQTNDPPEEEDHPGGENFLGQMIEQRSYETIHFQQLKIYPTPSSENVIVEWSSEIHQATDLNIYNAQGTLVEKMKIDSGIETSKELDITPFAPGVYFVNLISNNKIYTARLVKI